MTDTAFSSPDGPIDLSRTGPYAHLLNRKRLAAFDKLAGEYRCHDIPGQPTVKGAFAPWLYDALAFICCTHHKSADGLVRTAVQKALIFCGKKQGKSSGTAFLVIAAAHLATRPAAKIVLASAQQGGVAVLFGAVEGMIRISKPSAWDVRPHLNKATLLSSRRPVIQVKAFTKQALTGVLCYLLVLDEVSVIGESVADSIAIAQEAGGAVSITERQTVMLTTNQPCAPQGLFRVTLDQMRAVAAGTDASPGLLPVLYEPRPEIRNMQLAELLERPDLIREAITAATPSHGYSCRREDLIADLKATLPQGAEAVGSWLAKFANLRAAGLSRNGRPWPWAEYAPQCHTLPAGTHWRDILPGADRVVLAIDGGGSDDMQAVAVGALHGDTLKLWLHAFVYPNALKVDPRQAGKYQDLAAMGCLTLLAADAELHHLEHLAGEVLGAVPGDAAFQVTLDNGSRQTLTADLAPALERLGIASSQIALAPRGTATIGGSEALGRRLGASRVQIADTELSRWCFGNMSIDAKGWPCKPDGEAWRKIDAAIVCCFVQHALNTEPPSACPFFVL